MNKTPSFPFVSCTDSRSTNWRFSVSIINECLRAGFIRPSKAAMGTPVLFTPKKDGGLCMCTDYRELNAKSLRNRYPLPLIDDILHRLAGAKLFIALDMT